ncbi:MAG: hypothetical protein ABJA74_13190 [Lapillicoccus sp.]
MGDRAHGQGAGVGWALGSDDNDPATLWVSVLGALRDAVARGAEVVHADSTPEGADDKAGDRAAETDAIEAVEALEALESMRSPGPHATSAFDGRLARVLRDVPFPIWLLLDDAHLVRDPACLESLNLLMRAGHPPSSTSCWGLAPTRRCTYPACASTAGCTISATGTCGSVPPRPRRCSPPTGCG